LPQWIQNGSTGFRAALGGVIRGWTGITGCGAFLEDAPGLFSGSCGEFRDESGDGGVEVDWPVSPWVPENHCIVFASCWPIRCQEIPIMAIRIPIEYGTNPAFLGCSRSIDPEKLATMSENTPGKSLPRREKPIKYIPKSKPIIKPIMVKISEPKNE